MVLLSNGNVGIGTVSNTALHISGTNVADSRLTVTRSGVNGLVGIVGNDLLLQGSGSDGTNEFLSSQVIIVLTQN